ncbi:hypothetical protein DITRI_Ditri18aG0056600 [Diplodiscus trichospermus]
MLFFTVLWSLWLYRNEIVFKGRHLDPLKLIDTIKVRLAYWCKGNWPSLVASVDDFFFNIVNIYDGVSDVKSR